MFFLVYGLVAVAVRVGGTQLFDRFNQLALAAVGFVAYGGGLLALGAATSTTLFATAAALLGFGHGLLFPILAALVVVRARDSERGSAMAIFTALFDVAVLAAAPIVGAVIDWRGYSTAFVSLGFVVVAGLIVYVVWDRNLDTVR